MYIYFMPHIHEKIDFTADAFIVYNNTVLLRKHDKYNIWLGVGGHIELNEDPTEAVVREVKEEVGLTITLLDTRQVPAFVEPTYQELIPPSFMDRHRINDAHEHISLAYVALTDSNITSESESEKSYGLHWFTKNELTDPTYTISDHIRAYALKALELVAQHK